LHFGHFIPVRLLELVAVLQRCVHAPISSFQNYALNCFTASTLRAIFCRLCEAEKVDGPRAGCAGTLPRPGWFFLDKIFGGRKVKFVK